MPPSSSVTIDSFYEVSQVVNPSLPKDLEGPTGSIRLHSTVRLPQRSASKGRGQRCELRRASVADVQAYILIQTEVGKAAQVAKEVREIEGVDAAEDVTGPYDVIVRASAGNVDDLGKLVVAKIQAVEGITRTLTCPVVHL